MFRRPAFLAELYRTDPPTRKHVSISLSLDGWLAVEREDGSWLLAGYMPADEMADHLGIMLPENRDYETVAGSFVVPAPASSDRRNRRRAWLAVQGRGLDNRRIDKSDSYACRQPRPFSGFQHRIATDLRQ